MLSETSAPAWDQWRDHGTLACGVSRCLHGLVGACPRPEMSGSVKALSRWLVIVAALRLLSVYIGLVDPGKFRTALIDLQPELVNDLYGRLFATWTLLTCGLCIICARNPTNSAIYGATLLSFVVALVHFLSELLIFRTMSIKGAAAPMVIAGLSTLWMGAGWNYYTVYSKQGGPSTSEQVNGPTAGKAEHKEE